MISRKGVQGAIDDASVELKWCWDVLASIKDGHLGTDIGQAIIRFQTRLLDAIFSLERTYRQIKQEEKRLIAVKSAYDPDWFARRMSQLSNYSKGLKDVLAIGRTLGDGFAWLFYERDRDLIAEHLKHQLQPLLPPGIGGLGERASLEKLQGFGHQLLIYHGITTFLRMGDVSFIDLSTRRVASIGEIKTQKIDDKKCQATVSLVAENVSHLPTNLMREGSGPPRHDFDQKTLERFCRQMRQLADAVHQTTNLPAGPRVSTNARFHFDALKEAVSESNHRKIKIVKAAPGLLIGALRLPNVSLGGRVLGGNFCINNKIEGVEEAVRSITDVRLRGNAIHLGTFGWGIASLAVTVQTIPIFWWDIPQAVLREILFGEVIVITLYNPAHFWEKLRLSGFELIWDEGQGQPQARRQHNGRILKLENLEYFSSLAQRGLMAEESMIEMIEQFTAASLEVPEGAPVRIEMHPRFVR